MANDEKDSPSGASISHSQKFSSTISDSDGKGCTGLSDPFSNSTSNAFSSSTAKSAPQATQQTEQSSEISSICPQDIPLPQSDDTERLLETVKQAETMTFTTDDEGCDQIDADLNEANSTDDEDFSFDDSDMILDDEDDDIPLEDDPFFGDPSAQITDQVTELQLEEIRKAMEEAQKIEDEMPALDVETTLDPADALLSEQNTSPKVIVVNIGSSFSRWIYLVVEPTAPMFEMKLKFIEAADLGFEELERLEFTFDGRIIKDDDTVELLGIEHDTDLYCQMAESADRRRKAERRKRRKGEPELEPEPDASKSEPITDVPSKGRNSSESSMDLVDVALD